MNPKAFDVSHTKRRLRTARMFAVAGLVLAGGSIGAILASSSMEGGVTQIDPTILGVLIVMIAAPLLVVLGASLVERRISEDRYESAAIVALCFEVPGFLTFVAPGFVFKEIRGDLLSVRVQPREERPVS